MKMDGQTPCKPDDSGELKKSWLCVPLLPFGVNLLL